MSGIVFKLLFKINKFNEISCFLCYIYHNSTHFKVLKLYSQFVFKCGSIFSGNFKFCGQLLSSLNLAVILNFPNQVLEYLERKNYKYISAKN